MMVLESDRRAGAAEPESSRRVDEPSRSRSRRAEPPSRAGAAEPSRSRRAEPEPPSRARVEPSSRADPSATMTRAPGLNYEEPPLPRSAEAGEIPQVDPCVVGVDVEAVAAQEPDERDAQTLGGLDRQI